ncbi:hypothetical protein [Stakelama saccharophila]|uniref:Uncharacterized protein n=1 Tax=Stakelama saccharophila TaxID=3075605 RepID=A0ABZ0B833_9SPHN|nr:hypothetical protein [Stakelama sp. W311]WNO53170.1 hypothetical protein RPR59_12045 [Stakelama sp. W311]
MNTTTARRQSGEARALLALMEIAKHANWRLDRTGASLSPRFATHLYSDSAQLLLVPSIAELDWQLRSANAAMREARSDALIATLGPSGAELRFAIGLWTSARNMWFAPAWPWVDRSSLWFGCDDLPGEAFPVVEGRLQRKAAPWRDGADEEHGRAKASRWFERVLTGPSGINNK